MGKLTYDIRYDESINRWWITRMQREVFESPCETFEADVNLGEAYVQIVYPVRREFLKKNQIQETDHYEGQYDQVYFPFENNRIDFTTFLHMPHHIWVWGKTQIIVEETGEYPFEIYTCGGLKAWVNQEEAFCFAPYTRNIPGRQTVWLSLKEGINDIEVYADELAERDVFFYYEFRYKGQKPLQGSIELGGHVEEVLDAERFLKSCYFPKDLVKQGKVTLRYNNSLLQSDKRIQIMGDAELALLNNVEIEGVREIVARKDQEETDIGEVTDYNVGVFTVLLAIKTGEFAIVRNLVVGTIPEHAVQIQPAATEEERKKQALAFICEQGENVVTRTLAILETKQQFDDKALRGFHSSMQMIENHEDCADFYLAPMFLLITRYRSYLTDSQYDRIKQGMLHFRYWIDEPGNDVMWYFSENHALLFHISQYLSGYFFPDDVFQASNKTGKEQHKIGKQRLEHWFATFFQYGFAEWNSGTYIPVDLIGFFVLYEMAPDSEIKDMARRALDFTFTILSYNTYQGVMCSSYGRVYEDTLKVRNLMEPNFLTWVAYGQGTITSGSRAVTLYSLSDYQAPDCFTMAQPAEHTSMSFELDQGMNQVKTYGFKTPDYFMACVRRFKPFVHGHQQHLMNVALGERAVQYFINHPGERPYSGGNRPSYWAGNGTIPYIEQYQNVMMLLFQTDPNELVHAIHAYTPLYEYDEYAMDGNWFFIRCGRAYAGTWFSNSYKLTEEGANTGKEIISDGLNHGVVVRCGSEDEFGSFEAFKEALYAMQITYNGREMLKFEDPKHGWMEIQDQDHIIAAGKALPYEAANEMIVKKG